MGKKAKSQKPNHRDANKSGSEDAKAAMVVSPAARSGAAVPNVPRADREFLHSNLRETTDSAC